jgi:hypothetical protein
MKQTNSIRIIVFLVSLVVASCSGPTGEQYPRYSTFPNEEQIIAQVIPIDTALFRYPSRVTVREGVAVVLDLHNLDHYLHAFTYPAWKHIASFGKRGEGPEEMLSAETFQFNSLDSIWSLDANKMEITRWSISVAHGTVQRVEEVNLDKSLIRSLDFHATDSGFIVPDYMGTHRYWQLDDKGSALQSYGEIPIENKIKASSRPALAQAWRSFIDYNPTNGVLAMATHLGEVIEVYNLKENKQTILYGPDGEPRFRTTSEGKALINGIKGFSDVKVTDNYIYAVFHGRKLKDIRAAYERGEKPKTGGKQIYVFDLQGNPVKKYTLDRYIYAIDVNEQTNTITATEVDSDNPIIEFKIS